MSESKVAEVWQTCTTSYLNAEGVSAEALDVRTMMSWVGAWTLTPREAMVADLAMQG
jgi:hypothetical protein